MTEQKIIVSKNGTLGRVTINQPETRNALSSEMWGQLADGFSKLESDNEVRVIIITGAGEQAFISGADIGELQQQTAAVANSAAGSSQVEFTVAAIQAITDSSKPVIAMINGICFGGGVLIATACDLRFACDAARFAIPAVKIGAAYPAQQGIERLVKMIGATQVADLLLSGRTIDAQEALQIGLINRVVESAKLEEETKQYTMKMAEGAPLTLTAHKLAIQNLLKPSTQQNDQAVSQAMVNCYRSEDFTEGVAAFLEKRRPIFKGR